ncbi:T-cell surface antigen CD2 isoform X1 [Sciurus carolinensis]|uniref:T-cell surface antigen CD2 isoform X1 n=1 Tax=Sciurus carolinensis TaxID=30640 RepID=UPI001FB561C8|nr:T-cell surface antigen CD2 isoform X1 [Sciurus carolinensis]
MSLLCKLFVSFLLIFNFPTKGSVSKDIRIVWGALDQDINLDIPSFQMSDVIDDIRWDKEGIMVAQFRKGKKPSRYNETYEILANGTLKIKHLKKYYNNIYNVIIYNTDGKSVLEQSFDLRILEMVSKPKISWDCNSTNLTCEIMKGTDPELNLYQNGKRLTQGHLKVIRHQWTNLNAAFKCTASNRVSEESSMAAVSCSEKGLNIYIIAGVGAGGILLVFVLLLIFFVSKRKKQNSRRHDEELEVRTHRTTSEGSSQKPSQIPTSPPQNPAASQPPPPPGHRSQTPAHRPQTPAHRPLPPGHRVQHQQQKRTPPSSTQVRQQRGPPLPRPRVQPKPPCGVAENSSSPSSNFQ